MYGLANRLWHTDTSFQDPPGRYSLLVAKVIPPVGAEKEFADMRAAYDALPLEMKAQLAGLRVHHSIAHSPDEGSEPFAPDNAFGKALRPFTR
jgi:alpha-ketoglutarate-dependent 2,4-dichlorophenoxyacetate dioxygenase